MHLVHIFLFFLPFLQHFKSWWKIFTGNKVAQVSVAEAHNIVTSDKPSFQSPSSAISVKSHFCFCHYYLGNSYTFEKKTNKKNREILIIKDRAVSLFILLFFLGQISE